MAKLVNIGFGNVVNFDKVYAVVNPDAAPIKRIIQYAKDQGRAIDATQGRKTRAVIIMENGSIVLSAIQPQTIVNRQPADGLAEECAILARGNIPYRNSMRKPQHYAITNRSYAAAFLFTIKTKMLRKEARFLGESQASSHGISEK